MNTLLTVTFLGVVAFIAGMLRFQKFISTIFIAALAGAVYLAVADWGQANSYFKYMVVFDNYALAFSILLLITTLLWMLIAGDYLNDEKKSAYHFGLVSLVLSGAVILVSYNDLTMMFIGMEILSVAAYFISATGCGDKSPQKTAFGYFVRGLIASVFILAGIAFLYGAAGSFNIKLVSVWIFEHHQQIPVTIKAGVILMIAGLMLKITALPFQTWLKMKDDGLSLPVLAYLSTVIPVIIIVTLYKLMISCFVILADWWGLIIAVISASIMLGANILAAVSKNLKRRVIYAGIAHIGFLLMPVAAINQLSQYAILYYSAAFIVGNLGLYLMLSRMRSSLLVENLRGLSKGEPVAAALVAVIVLSIAGMPPLAGYFGKYYILRSVFNSELLWLMITGIITALISMYYYLSIPLKIYAKGSNELQLITFNKSDQVMLFIIAGVTIGLSVVPWFMIKLL